MNRRFVNLVLVTRMHSLFRLDVAKHLFYPSTAQAEAANAKQETNNGGGGGGGDNKPRKPPKLKWPKSPMIKLLGRLPEPCMRFFQFPPADDGDEEPEPPWRSYDVDAFMLLRPSCSDGTILHATNGGRTVIYDADKNAICATLPFFDTGMGGEPVVFSIPGAGSEEKERLYVMRSTFASPVHHYDHRRYYYPPPNNDEDDEDHRCSGDFVVLDFNNQPFKWQHLPRPPFVVDKGCSAGSNFRIRSSAVVDGGRAIVVSADERSNGYSIECSGGVEFTYCFDTATRQWRHAGNWALPFSGRAEYVPELNTWIGLSLTSPHHLCAIVLSSAMDAGDQAPPTPHHVWDDFTPPPDTKSSAVLNRHHPQYVLHRSSEWCPAKHSMVNLGSGRFCTLKVFFIRRRECVGFYEPDMDKPDDEEFAVLTGVEVVRCHDGEEEGGLRMVKHKSKRCVLDHDHWLF